MGSLSPVSEGLLRGVSDAVFSHLCTSCVFSVFSTPVWRGALSRVPVSEQATGAPRGDGGPQGRRQEQTSSRLSCSPGGGRFRASLSGRSIDEAPLNRNARTRRGLSSQRERGDGRPGGPQLSCLPGGMGQDCSLRVLVTLWNVRTWSNGKGLDFRSAEMRGGAGGSPDVGASASRVPPLLPGPAELVAFRTSTSLLPAVSRPQWRLFVAG